MSHRRLGQLVALGLVAGLFAAQAASLCAQTAGSARITDVTVTGLKRVPHETVMQAIRLRPGDVFSLKAVDDDIRRLNRLGQFYPTGINVRQEAHRDGVRLIYDLRERPVISKITFIGNRKFSEKKLLKTVGLKVGSPLDFARQRESTSSIETLYREKRYQYAEVRREETTDAARNTVAITFHIKEGPQVTLKAIRFEGNRAFSRSKLLSQMETRTRRWLLFTQVFDESVFKMDLVRLRRFYKQQGYLDALVSGDYQYSADKSELTLIVKISEGGQYRVGDVSVRGQTIVTGGRLLRELDMKKGEMFNILDYEHDVRALHGFYTSRGYIDVRVTPKEVFPEPGRIDLVYEITENTQSRLGMLDIRGNFKTKDKVIRREFRLFPGDVFDVSQVTRGVSRLRRLRYFEKIETTFVPSEEPGERDLVVEVTEGQTGHVLFGAGVSSNEGLIGQFQLTLENFDIADWPTSFEEFISGNSFVGAGQRLSLLYRPGTELQQAAISFSDPYVFDTRFGLYTSFFLYDRERDDYEEDRLGMRLGLGREITDRLQARLTFRMEEVKIKDPDVPTAPDVLAVLGSSEVNSLAFRLDYNRVDDPWQPSAGYRTTGVVEWSGDALGSDFNFLRGTLDGKYYHTLFKTRSGRKHVLALGARAGAVDAISGDGAVPLFERFYAGGRNSVRGFDYRGLGPEQLGTEVGGEFTLVTNVEYIFPIYQTIVEGRPLEMIRGVLFCDMGQVAYRLQDIDDTTWRTSVGVGVRLHIPALGGIPISLDWGFPVHKAEDDDERVFSFSIGTMF